MAFLIGLAASIAATIKERSGKVKMGIMESIAILEDTRMQILGGVLGIIDIYELALIPTLLYSCETWNEISIGSIKELENIQYLFLRMVFQLPVSTRPVTSDGK